MNHVPMAMPALHPTLFVTGSRHFGHPPFVAPHAVFLNNGSGKRRKFHRLRIGFERKGIGMFQTIHRFERILPDKRRMGKMTIGTRNIPAMRRIPVRNVGICHHMTIHTRFRRIIQVRRYTGNMCQEQSRTAKNPQQDQCGYPKLGSEKTQLHNRYHENA